MLPPGKGRTEENRVVGNKASYPLQRWPKVSFLFIFGKLLLNKISIYFQSAEKSSHQTCWPYTVNAEYENLRIDVQLLDFFFVQLIRERKKFK